MEIYYFDNRIQSLGVHNMSKTSGFNKYSIKYSVQLHSPLGIKNGELILDNDKNKITGKLFILNTECSVFNVITSENNYEFRCVIKTIIGDITCEVHLTDKCGSLYGMVKTNKCCMAVTGQRTPE